MEINGGLQNTFWLYQIPTWGQKCIFSKLQPFELANFYLGHPVQLFTFDNFQFEQLALLNIFLPELSPFRIACFKDLKRESTL